LRDIKKQRKLDKDFYFDKIKNIDVIFTMENWEGNERGLNLPIYHLRDLVLINNKIEMLIKEGSGISELTF
jgi:hypothetical protein